MHLLLPHWLSVLDKFSFFMPFFFLSLKTSFFPMTLFTSSEVIKTLVLEGDTCKCACVCVCLCGKICSILWVKRSKNGLIQLKILCSCSLDKVSSVPWLKKGVNLNWDEINFLVDLE